MNLEGFKSKLTKQKTELEKQIEHYRSEDPFKKSLRSTEVLDDAITEIEEHDRLLATSEELQKDLADVEAALVRIEVGTYGVCVNCGEQIETERLEVMPTATLCLSCQRKLKRR